MTATMSKAKPAASRLPMSLKAYRLLTRMFGGLAPRILAQRAARGKEDPERLTERMGKATVARPDGPLIWLHGASVGESLMLLILLNALRNERPDAAFLVTTGTVTSAQLMAKRLPRDAIHQYIPVDRADAAAAFLDHWRPGMGIFAESELWPNLILEAQARHIPLALVNARMTEKSLRRWQSWSGAARRLFDGFVWIGAADSRTADGLTRVLGRPVERLGNLKLAANPPEANQAIMDSLKEHAGPRERIWLAASTHDGEDAIVLDAHSHIRATIPDALLVLAPRHPNRGADVTELARSMGFETARRSTADVVHDGTAVYVADTLGEMGTWYAIADATFIAGSLRPDVGGHTPLEAARVGTPIISGPNTANFADIFAELTAANGATIAATSQELADAILALNEKKAAQMTKAALKVAERGGQVLDDTLAGVRPFLPEHANAGA